MRINLLSVLLLGSAPVLVSATEANDLAERPRHMLSLGGYYGKGDFGEPADTAIWYTPLSYEYSVSSWRLRATVPWLKISGSGNVLVNVGGLSRPEVPEQPVSYGLSAEGLGDVVLNATWELPAWSDSAPFFDLGVEIKLPTADETAGLGTGASDYALQADMYQMLGVNTLFVTLGYRLRGSSEWFDGLQDSAYASLGWSRPWGGADAPPPGEGQWSWGVIYDFREAASMLSDDTHELLPYVSWAPVPRWSFMLYASKGYGRDTPDHAGGVQLNYRW